MVKLRIAVATDGKNGIDDAVSNVFGRAKTFTIVDVDDEKIISVKVLENPALSYSHGAGPIAIKTLIDDGVKVVIANELGIGASEILQQHNIIYIQEKPGTNAGAAIKNALRTQNKKS
ncbi:NifB/NifX family molybdenum-iron cluster-binding protein [Candidatus Bathyarchaeota archaeon]|nr:NifB/NifX family molybdenum-iron cluster-binding protein [Candidatus Bathyarchaeota archaeon]